LLAAAAAKKQAESLLREARGDVDFLQLGAMAAKDNPKIKFQDFSDGEFEPVLDQSVRGGRVFLIGSTFPPADNLLELLLMIDAAKRASAEASPLEGSMQSSCLRG
jgi:hypothetical protein